MPTICPHFHYTGRGMALALPLLSQLRHWVMKFGRDCDAYVVGSLMSMYGRHWATSVARRLLDQSSMQDMVCWTSFITGYCSIGLM
ncbi:hypothetical protein ACJRO7_014995 [Eucalyptus globulus]|uniref:Uncharacterized protein n=1 Tax=Eucalyptus globulus TaxID=34317 RepID=A0ABD3L233_EUCGL